MACAKCRQRKTVPVRTVQMPASLSGNVVEDRDLYYVQSRMYTVVSEEGGGAEILRFLPGERVNLTGALLYYLLSQASDLFIFLRSAEKDTFIKTYPSFVGVV